MILRFSILLLSLFFITAQLVPEAKAADKSICTIVTGAEIFAQDSEQTYLGKITHSYDSQSILNSLGTYGSEYSGVSIWNSYGTFGSKYSAYSPFNSYTSTPPKIIKNGRLIGYLSESKSLASAISPTSLKALCK